MGWHSKGLGTGPLGAPPSDLSATLALTAALWLLRGGLFMDVLLGCIMPFQGVKFRHGPVRIARAAASTNISSAYDSLTGRACGVALEWA